MSVTHHRYVDAFRSWCIVVRLGSQMHCIRSKVCGVWRAGTHKITVWISRWPPHCLKLNLFWMWYGSRSFLNKLLPIFATRESSHKHTHTHTTYLSPSKKLRNTFIAGRIGAMYDERIMALPVPVSKFNAKWWVPFSFSPHSSRRRRRRTLTPLFYEHAGHDANTPFLIRFCESYVYARACSHAHTALTHAHVLRL